MTLIKPQFWRKNKADAFPMIAHPGGINAAKTILAKNLGGVAYDRPDAPPRFLAAPFFEENGFHAALVAAERYLQGEFRNAPLSIRHFWAYVEEAKDEKSNMFKLSVGALGI